MTIGANRAVAPRTAPRPTVLLTMTIAECPSPESHLARAADQRPREGEVEATRALRSHERSTVPNARPPLKRCGTIAAAVAPRIVLMGFSMAATPGRGVADGAPDLSFPVVGSSLI